MSRRRLDTELVSRGLFATVEHARQAIEARLVLVNSSTATKFQTMVEPAANITVRSPKAYVSRGGDKLAGALEDFHLEVRDRKCFDAGAGSGGFTDCLLRLGASHVTAVDVGYGQFDWSLRNDPRVNLIERTNLRLAAVETFEGPYDVVVADLSFISLKRVLAVFLALSAPVADWILLVKPQFEAPRDQVGPGGIVRDPEVWESVMLSITDACNTLGVTVAGTTPSRLKGASGNQEFFLWAKP
ncbi:MAG: TlyA family RNA methyltransferase [Actinomycetota bacterium]